MQHQPFDCTLSAAPSYRLGEPILVTFSIRNKDSETYQFLTWGTPLDDEVTDFLTVVFEGRKVIEYDGRLVQRGDPSDCSYVTLRPGQSLSKQVDISPLYPIDQPGSYTAILKAILFDAASLT